MDVVRKMTEPKFVVTPRMAQILDIVDPMEEELDKLRQLPRFNNQALVDRIRELRKVIGKLLDEYWEISLTINKEWHAQPPLWKKGA